MEEIQVLGLAELEAKLESLPKKLADRGVRKALKAGSNVIYRIMESLCPRVEKFIPGAPPGWLADHLGSKIKMLSGYIGGYAYIGPQGKIDYPDAAVAKLGTGGFRIKHDKKGRAHAAGRIRSEGSRGRDTGTRAGGAGGEARIPAEEARRPWRSEGAQGREQCHLPDYGVPVPARGEVHPRRTAGLAGRPPRVQDKDAERLHRWLRLHRAAGQD